MLRRFLLCPKRKIITAGILHRNRRRVTKRMSVKSWGRFMIGKVGELQVAGVEFCKNSIQQVAVSDKTTTTITTTTTGILQVGFLDPTNVYRTAKSFQSHRTHATLALAERFAESHNKTQTFPVSPKFILFKSLQAQPNMELCNVSISSSRCCCRCLRRFCSSYSGSSVGISCRHIGHELVFSSHARMQESWNSWLQGSVTNFWPARFSFGSRQIAHFSSSAVTKRDLRFFTSSFEAGGGRRSWSTMLSSSSKPLCCR